MIGRTNASILFQQLIQLDAPTGLLITGQTLSWNSVANATSYDVYKNDTLYQNVLTTSIDLSALPVGTYSMQVVAKAEGYTDSVKSQAINYIYGQLLAPTGLRRDGNYLKWNAVSNATTYIIYCTELSQSWTTSTTQKEFASILTGSGTYHLSVKARGTGYADSAYSDEFGWEGGTATFTVLVKRADSYNALFINVDTGGASTRLSYDDSVSYTAAVGTSITVNVEWEYDGYPNTKYWSYSYSGGSDSGTTTSGKSESFVFTSSDTLDLSYT